MRAYKRLGNVEKAFRTFKGIDLRVRPIHHRLADRIRAHLFLCMLAYYVEWQMRQQLAPILFDDEDKEQAESMLLRAQADGELAAALSRGDADKKEAALAIERVQQLRQDNQLPQERK